MWESKSGKYNIVSKSNNRGSKNRLTLNPFVSDQTACRPSIIGSVVNKREKVHKNKFRILI